jgi:hypothetical protein
MTLAELRAEVFRRLGESSSAPVFWTLADVDAALNEAYNDISDASEWYEKWVTIDLLHTRPEYDLRTVTSDTVLKVGKAFNETTHRWLIPTCTKELDGGYRTWESTPGSATRLFTRGLWWVSYYPLTLSDTGTVRQYYATLPDPLAGDSDVEDDVAVMPVIVANLFSIIATWEEPYATVLSGIASYTTDDDKAVMSGTVPPANCNCSDEVSYLAEVSAKTGWPVVPVLPSPVVSTVDTTDSPGFPETLHYGLVEYALCDLWAQDAEVDKALQAWQQYLTYENGLKAFVQGKAAVPLVHGHV